MTTIETRILQLEKRVSGQQHRVPAFYSFIDGDDPEPAKQEAIAKYRERHGCEPMDFIAIHGVSVAWWASMEALAVPRK